MCMKIISFDFNHFTAEIFGEFLKNMGNWGGGSPELTLFYKRYLVIAIAIAYGPCTNILYN